MAVRDDFGKLLAAGPGLLAGLPGLRGARRRHRPHPVDRSDQPVPVLRRIQPARQLHLRGAAASGSPTPPDGRGPARSRPRHRCQDAPTEAVPISALRAARRRDRRPDTAGGVGEPDHPPRRHGGHRAGRRAAGEHHLHPGRQVRRATATTRNNKRILFEEASRQRGQITAAGGVVLASPTSPTTPTAISASIRPTPRAYADLTGYYSLTYGPSRMEAAQDDLLSGNSADLLVDRVGDFLTGRDPRGGNVELTIGPPNVQHGRLPGAGRRPGGRHRGRDPTVHRRDPGHGVHAQLRPEPAGQPQRGRPAARPTTRSTPGRPGRAQPGRQPRAGRRPTRPARRSSWWSPRRRCPRVCTTRSRR